MTDVELVKRLADGNTIIEISKSSGINRRTLEKRIVVLRERCLCNTVAQLVAVYFRKKLIE